MELRITGEAAEALVKNIETYVNMDIFDEESDSKSLGLMLAIGWMFDDLLAQAGLNDRKLTELELLHREKEEFYIPLTDD